MSIPKIMLYDMEITENQLLGIVKLYRKHSWLYTDIWHQSWSGEYPSIVKTPKDELYAIDDCVYIIKDNFFRKNPDTLIFEAMEALKFHNILFNLYGTIYAQNSSIDHERKYVIQPKPWDDFTDGNMHWYDTFDDFDIEMFTRKYANRISTPSPPIINFMIAEVIKNKN